MNAVLHQFVQCPEYLEKGIENYNHIVLIPPSSVFFVYRYVANHRGVIGLINQFWFPSEAPKSAWMLDNQH